MRKVSFLLLAAVLLAGFVPFAAQADDGSVYMAFYDFEDYSAAHGSGIEPDENWGNVKYLGNAGKSNYGSYYDGPEHGTVLRVTRSGEPNLFFGQVMRTGKLHISCDIKIIGNSLRAMFIGYDARNPDDPKTVSNADYYAWLIRLNSYNGLVDYTYLGTSQRDEIDMGYTPEEWHRIDIVTTELSSTSPSLQYYLDGVLVNQETISIPANSLMKSFGLRADPNTGQTVEENDCILLDNVRVERYFGERSLTASALTEAVALQDGVLNVNLSEPVDPSRLTKSNVRITHMASGNSVDNFSIENASNGGFTVRFDGAIEAGRYQLMLQSGVVGDIFKSPMATPLIFRTEDAVKVVTSTFADEDFDDYTAADGALPPGFVNLEGASFTPRSLSGADGTDDDHAFGFENEAAARTVTRFMYRFGTPVLSGSPFDVEFDVYAQNAYWYLYLGEEGDFDAGNTDYNQNVAIATANSAGLIRYADSRSSIASGDIDSALTAPPGQWNHVRLSVIPNDSGSVYRVSVNGGTEYEVTTQRRFEGGVYGFGLGYIALSAGCDVRFDNVKIEGTMNIIYPMVNTAAVYACDGSEIAAAGAATSLISHAVLEYNTRVDTETAKARIALRNRSGSAVGCEYLFEEMNDRTYVTLRFPALLDPGEQYTLTADAGVASAFDSEVTATDPFSLSFVTEDTADFKLFGEQLDTENGQYTISFAKNNDAEGRFYVAVCAVETVTRSIDGVETEVEQLKGIRYVPVDISAEDRGIFTYSVDAPFIAEEADIRTYIWNWPSLTKVLTDSIQ